jgi:hypothetical protein
MKIAFGPALRGQIPAQGIRVPTQRMKHHPSSAQIGVNPKNAFLPYEAIFPKAFHRPAIPCMPW